MDFELHLSCQYQEATNADTGVLVLDVFILKRIIILLLVGRDCQR